MTAPAVAVAGNGQFLVVWQDRRNGNDDIYGQRLTSSGGLTGSNFVIANSSSAETAPALAWHSSANAYLVVWQRDGNVWARPLTSRWPLFYPLLPLGLGLALALLDVWALFRIILPNLR